MIGPIIASVWLAGCAAAFVPDTSDPHEKLKWAGGLVHMGSRPLPAEWLIQEAITIFAERGDEVGLAAAYRVYGSFFASPAIEQWRRWYSAHGFRDKTATVDNRYTKSIEYFQRAVDIYTRYHRTDWLTYVYLNMGRTYEAMGERDPACHAFEKSAENHAATAHFDPEINVAANYNDMVTAHKKKVCTPP